VFSDCGRKRQSEFLGRLVDEVFKIWGQENLCSNHVYTLHNCVCFVKTRVVIGFGMG